MPTRFERLFELLDSHESDLRVNASHSLALTLQKANSTNNKDRIKACLVRAYEALTSKSARRRDASRRLLGEAASTVVLDTSCVPPTSLKLSSLKGFGVNNLIKKGARLFGSSGNEYDVKTSVSWEKQRDALLREISMSSRDENVSLLPSNHRIDREIHSDLVPTTTTSTTTTTSSSVSSNRKSASRLLLVNSTTTTINDKITTWSTLMTRLSSDLLSSTWHVRHGAAIGLASVIPQLQTPLSSVFLEDCAVRCVCLLALDRFKDFYLGTARAPCAEAAARLISSLKKNPALTYELFADVLSHDETPWPTRHSVLIAIHLMKNTTTKPPSKLCESVRESLSNTVEGVQVAAAQAFLSTTMLYDVSAKLACKSIESRVLSFGTEDEEDVVYVVLFRFFSSSLFRLSSPPPITHLKPRLFFFHVFQVHNTSNSVSSEYKN